MCSILVVSQSRAIRNSVTELLEYEKHRVFTIADYEEIGKVLLQENFSLIVAQVTSTLSENRYHPSVIRASAINLPIVYIVDKNVSLKYEQYDSIFQICSRPINIRELISTVNLAIEASNELVETNPTEVVKLDEDVSPLDSIIGCSQKILQLKHAIEIVAPTMARVLITGGNGTGKEMVATALHKLSSRSGKKFLGINCAALPNELIESEMFGHEKGAFTSATKVHQGKFELASGGTLFLDEIGDMGLPAQSKLLRALQEKKICRVGGDIDIEVDVRVLAATNKNLENEISDRTFREDLYHRLNVVEIYVPSLDERIDDIPLLARHFVKHFCSQNNLCDKIIDDSAIEMLQCKKWRGNVRQLQNTIERLALFSGDTITADCVNSFGECRIFC